MKKIYTPFLVLALTLLSACAKDSVGTSEDSQAADSARIAELNAYWAEVSRCVNEGDFVGYTATCHKDGVIVSGESDKAYPLSDALKRWKKDFTATKSGEVKASVEFRFSKRLGDATTAHETGMFLYTSVDAEGEEAKYYIRLEALLLKGGTWKIMMEHQRSEGTEEEWNKLPPMH